MMNQVYDYEQLVPHSGCEGGAISANVGQEQADMHMVFGHNWPPGLGFTACTMTTLEFDLQLPLAHTPVAPTREAGDVNFGCPHTSPTHPSKPSISKEATSQYYTQNPASSSSQ